MNIFNIPSNFDFLKSICKFVINNSRDELFLSNFTILLPSRRSCNELRRIFLENSDNNSIILPKIKAVGDVDYDDLLLKKINKDDLEKFTNFFSNTSRVKYKLLLIKELIKWSISSDKDMFINIGIEQATNLALELENFLNEVNKNGLDLNDLQNIVDDEYSKHWQEVLNFLEVFGRKWNNFIKDNNIISLVDFKTKMIEFNAEYFEKNKPLNSVIIAGVSANVKSTSDLIKNLVKHDNCFYFFKGLDKYLNDKEWKNIDSFHCQYTHKNLLNNCIKIDRQLVKDIKFEDSYIVENNIEKVISYSMLPYKDTYKWQDKLDIKEKDFSNISKIECSNEFEELSIISLIVKHYYESSSKTITVIVPNETFGNQLEIKLKSLNIDVNNTFGNKISRTEIVKFLFLIIDVLKSDYESIGLLSLLKHKFSLFGYEKNKFDKILLLFEDEILRKFGNLDLKNILKKVKEFGNTDLIDFISKISSTLNEFDYRNLNFQDVIKLHIKTAEKIASNFEFEGFDVFWNNEENGDELLKFFTELIKESDSYGKVKDFDEYSYLLDYLIAENSYSEKYSIHPMVNIISPQEARLINYDLVILANLNEGKFPPHISNDPWMSKSMRKVFGLPDKEQLIGDFAYDFTQLICNNEVVLTRSLKDCGVPTIKSKYLMRFETFLLCQNNLKILENNIWKDVFEKLNNTEKNIVINRPKPLPPLDKRPRELYATKIEKLMNNPYDIYAEKILKLKKKDDFYENKVFAFFGSAVHEALEKYIKNYKSSNKDDLYKKLIQYGKDSFEKYFVNPTSKKLFFIRFLNIAKWFIEEDEKIRLDGYNVYAERVEKLYIEDLDFTLSAKIDRIEEDKFNSVNIVDYKTGNVPGNKDVLSGKKPQLVIEAIILKDKKIDKLVYWSIKGKGNEEIKDIKCNIDDLIEKGNKGVRNLISYFNDFGNSYLATGYELSNNNFPSDYKHLSRVEEWGYSN